MDVSVIIVNWKTRGLLKQNLKALEAARAKLAYEVFVVDNASGDGSVEMVRELFPEVRVLALDRNIGFARANNLAMREASGAYVFILNPDAMVTDCALEAMHRYMETHPDVGLLGPKLVHPDRTTQESAHRFPIPWIPVYRRTPIGRLPHARRALDRYSLRGELEGDEPRQVDWMEGAALFARRKAIDQVGMFDERYFAYMEDADWARRFWLAGWKVVWFPEARVWHYHRRESADAPWLLGLTSRVTRIHISSAVKYFMKWRGQPLPDQKPN